MIATDIENLHRAHILSALSARQGHTSDRIFATKLGVPPRALQAARRGGHSLGIPLLAALARAYPELEQAARAYLWVLVIERQETLKRARPSQSYPKE